MLISHLYIFSSIILNIKAAVTWRNLRIPKNLQNVSVTETYLQLPVEYESSSEQKFGFHVTRISRGIPRNHLIMLAGGPGQKGSFYLHRAWKIVEYLQEDFVVYFPTHRGIGKSCKISGSKQIDWNALRNSPIPLESLTVLNASRDVMELARLIKSSPEFSGSISKLSLYGVSYGGLWAVRTVQLVGPSYFDSLILNSPLVVENFIDPGNDMDFIDLCFKNEFCRNKVGDQPENLRNIPSFVGDENYNGCTQILHKYLQSRGPLTVGREDDSHFRFQSFLKELRNFGVQTAMLTIPLLLQLYTCPSTSLFENKIMPVIVTLGQRGSVPSLSDPFISNLGDGSSINALANYYLLSTELYDFHSEVIPSDCAAKSPMGLLSECTTYWRYRDVYNMQIKHFVNLEKRKTDPFRQLSSLNAGETVVYLVHSRADILTPFPAVEAFFNRIKATKKRLILSEVLPHAPKLQSECAKIIFEEIFHGGHQRITDACMIIENGAGLDWEFRDSSMFAEFWPKITAKLPTQPDPRITIPFRSQLGILRSVVEYNEALDWNYFIFYAFTGFILLTPSTLALHKLYKR